VRGRKLVIKKEESIKYLSRRREIVELIIDPVISFGQKVMNEELSQNGIEKCKVGSTLDYPIVSFVISISQLKKPAKEVHVVPGSFIPR
jgi:hypothetical protein